MATIDLGKIKLLWKGAWSNSTTYEFNDVVKQGNQVWICTNPYTPDSTDRYSPGYRGITNAYGTAFDPEWEPYDFDVRVTSSKFIVEGVSQKSLNLQQGRTYRFRQNTSTNSGRPFMLSTTNDGTNNGGTVYSGNDAVFTGTITGNILTVTAVTSGTIVPGQILFNSLTGQDQFRQPGAGVLPNTVILYQQPGTIAGAPTAGGIGTYVLNTTYSYNLSQTSITATNVTYWLDGVRVSQSSYQTAITSNFTSYNNKWVQLNVPFQSTALYYYSAVGTSYGGSITLTASWTGWQYWGILSEGVSYQGTWSSATQYRVDDMITYQGSTYIALCDNLNKTPDGYNTHNYWHRLVSSNRGEHPGNVKWMPNIGPIEWPYPHMNQNGSHQYRGRKWIGQHGQPYAIGANTYGNHGKGDGQSATSYGEALCFDFDRWWLSRDNGGTGRHTTPHGMPPRCIQIEEGYSSTIFLFDDGTVYKIGYGRYDEMGTGYNTSTNSNHWARVVNFPYGTRIVKVSLAYQNGDDTHHYLALDEDGYVWTWGYNGYGQLGRGYTQDLSKPYRIPRRYFGNKRVIDVVATNTSYGWSIARCSDDTLYAWGYNGYGQLADGTTTNRYVPVAMTGWTPSANNGIQKLQVASWANSAAMAMLLDGNGYIWFVGYNGYGQAGNNTTSNVSTWTKVIYGTLPGTISNFWLISSNGYFSTWFRNTSGATYAAGYSGAYYSLGNGSTTQQNAPVQITKITNLRDVRRLGNYSDVFTTMWLTDNGRVYSFGYGGWGSVGNPALGGNSNGEDGSNYYPHLVFMPLGTRVKHIYFEGSWEGSTSYVGGHPQFVTDTGQLFIWGHCGDYIGYSNVGGHHYSAFQNNSMSHPYNLTIGR